MCLQRSSTDPGSRPALYAVMAGLVALAVYCIGFNYSETGDAISNELLAVTVLKEGNLYFNEFMRPDPYTLSKWGSPYFFRWTEKGIVAAYPIMPGLLNIPAYWLSDTLGGDMYVERYVLSKCTVAILSAASVAFMFLALVSVCERRLTALLMTSIYAFCTCTWSVAAMSLWQHGPALLFLSIALALLVGSERWMPYSGFFLGMAVVTRLTCIAFALPIALYIVVHHRRRWWPFFCSAAIPALLMFWYSYAVLDNILALGQGIELGESHAGHNAHLNSFLLAGLAGVLFSPSRGLFVFSPVYLFSVPVFVLVFREKAYPPLFKYFAGGAIAFILLMAKWVVWWGGWSFGYRMVMEALPVLTLFLALAWERWIRTARWLRIPFWLLVAASVYIHFLGAHSYPSGWNIWPGTVDWNASRLWDLKDTQIRRCHRKFLYHLRHPRLAARHAHIHALNCTCPSKCKCGCPRCPGAPIR